MANNASRTETGIPTSNEAAEITRTYFSIIRVCKRWYAMGIQALWSHLWINVCKNPIRAINGIQSAINRDKTLASYVIRLTLERTRRPAKGSFFIRALRTLTPRLPSLQIFICPGIYASGMAKLSLDIVVHTYPTPLKVYGEALRTPYIQNTRVLFISFQFENKAQSYRTPVLFPRLESLHLQTSCQRTINYFIRNWEIPNLRILSIESTSAIHWLKFIEKWSAIDILELSSKKSEWPRAIQLPNLKELRVSESLWTSYRIAAPRLEQICLLSFEVRFLPDRDSVIEAIDHARASFPALRRLQFRGLERLTSAVHAFDYSLTSSDISTWKEAGFEVDVPLPQS
jgi:hypothetical protein